MRPILVSSCTGCHAEGGIAPFALTTYDEVAEVADRVAAATRDRLMPPFFADNSGACNTWENYRGLTDLEIDVIQEWVDGGRPLGDPTTPAPEPPTLDRLQDPDLVLEMPDTYAIDGSVNDDYRCFVVETGLEEDMFATGYEVTPGNAQRVHHVIVYTPASDEAGDAARRLDATEGEVGDGYTCYGGPRVDAPPLVLWAPGAGATTFPEGTGVSVAAGRPQIIQIHYNNQVEGSPDTDRTSVALTLSDSASQAYILPIANLDIELPPRMTSVTQTATLDVGAIVPIPIDLRIWGAFPHMHTLGRSMNVTIHRAPPPGEDGDAVDDCLIDMPRWDFDWQLAYWLDDPMTFSTRDAVSITCSYNTISRDEVVTWGEGTLDEMCLNFVYVTIPLFGG
ncbi:MAG: hypothetical protein ACFCGT_21230 [Sandaracinaceae bacterium]